MRSVIVSGIGQPSFDGVAASIHTQGTPPQPVTIKYATTTPATGMLTRPPTLQHCPNLSGSISAVHIAFNVPAFDSGWMPQDRPGPVPDRILVAQLMGTARHHARWRELTADEEAAAVAELTELAAGRGDLLAEVAGITEGASEGRLDEPFARSAADLCRKAGADPEAIPAWIKVGRRRAEATRMPPPRYA